MPDGPEPKNVAFGVAFTTGGVRSKALSETALARRRRAPVFAQDIPPASTPPSAESTGTGGKCQYERSNCATPFQSCASS